MRAKHLVVSGLALFSVGNALQAAITFPSRENFNILNSDTVSITAEQTSGLSALPPSVLIMHQEAAWDGGPNPPGGFNQISINLNAVRNIKTIRAYENFGGYGVANAAVETSNDGITWTPQTSVTSVPDVRNSVIVLDNAVNAQYLRITPTQMQASGAGQSNRWIVGSLRVFGDVGSLTTDQNLDVVSSTAYASSPGVTMTLSSTSITDTTPAEFIDDRQNAADTIERQVLYSMGVGDGLTLEFNQPIEFDRFAFNYSTSGTADLNADYTVETSPDGVTYATVFTGTSQVHGPNIVDLTDTIGTHLRFTYTSSTSGDNRISDVMVFEPAAPIPEPAAFGLVGLLGAAAMRRRR